MLAGKFTVQNFGETSFRKRNHSLSYVESKQSFGGRANKHRAEPRNFRKGKMSVPHYDTNGLYNQEMPVPKLKNNFKTPRASILGPNKMLPSLGATVEQVHVYNSPGMQNPIRLNNIMI